MPSLPRKSTKGANFKAWTVETLDKFIDYFNSNWIQGGKNVEIKRTASGIVIDLKKAPSSAPEKLSAGGGGTLQDISATVTGGTASLALSGSTSSVNFVGTGSVTISGNTNTGNIEINATGGTSGATGLPDYGNSVQIHGSTVYGPFTYDTWLIGHVGQYEVDGADVKLTINGNTVIWLYNANFGSGTTQTVYVSVCIPIPAGNSFEITGYGDYNLSLFRCV